MLHKIKYHIIRPIKNLIRWFPVIWKDRDFDDHYIWEILKTKLKHQAKYIGEGDIFVNSKYDAQKMMLCVRLIEKIQDDYYEMEHMDYHKSEYNWIDAEDKPEYYQLEIKHISENFDDYFAKHKAAVRKVSKDKLLQIFELVPEEFKHKLAMNIGHYKQKQAQDILFKLMNRDIRGWWN
jgi:hypothetical protein